MLREYVEQFKILAPLQMPQLIDPKLLEDTECTDDYALLTFSLPQKLDIEEVLDLFEDCMELILFYHLVPTNATAYGQVACAYSNPQFGHMYKLNAISDDEGNCTSIYATIYASLEYMGEELRRELQRQSKRGHFTYQLSEDRLMSNFF